MEPESKVYVLRNVKGIGTYLLYFIKINKQVKICVNSGINRILLKDSAEPEGLKRMKYIKILTMVYSWCGEVVGDFESVVFFYFILFFCIFNMSHFIIGAHK